MPIDLATSSGRQTTTETLTRFKSETIPTDDRRSRAPKVEFNPTMRNAERPASQSEAIRKVLGLTSELQSNIVDLKQVQFAKSEEQNALIAAKDDVTGNVNKDVYDRSVAYRMVIADGRVHKAVANLAPTVSQDMTAYLNQHADADPTKGEMPVTLEDMNQRFDEHVKALLLDKDGKPIDYGDPRANTTLYRAIQQLRVKTLQEAADTIKSHEQDKATTAATDVALGELAQGNTAAIEQALQKGSAMGIDPAVMKKHVLQTVLNAANDKKDESIVSKAISSLRADGTTSTWNAEQQGILRSEYARMHSQFEADRKREREEASSRNMGAMLPDIMEGKLRVTPDAMRIAIAKGPANGGITAEHAEHLMSLQNTVDAKRQSEEANARARASFAVSMQDHAYMLSQRRAQEAVYSTQAAFFSGRMSQPQAIAGLDAQFKQGGLDNKAYVAVRTFLMNVPSPSKLVRKHDGEQFELSFKNDLAQVDRWVAARKAGFEAPEKWAVRRNEASAIFYTTLYSTGSPADSLRSAMEHINAPEKMIKQRLDSASRLQGPLTVAQKALQQARLGATMPAPAPADPDPEPATPVDDSFGSWLFHPLAHFDAK